jgi:hypothetical protein
MEMTLTSEGSTNLVQRRSQSPPRAESHVAYPPPGISVPVTETHGSSRSKKSWLGRLFRHDDSGLASYQPVGSRDGDEELAPLHRLHDEDDIEDGDSSEEFELVNGERDASRHQR